MKTPNPQVTLLLNQAAEGDRQAADQLLPLVYQELRRLAQYRLSALPPGQTLQATALVHEAYLQVTDRQEEGWAGRRHFFFAAARAMRDILVDDARRKASAKRGGDLIRIEIDEVFSLSAPADRLLSLDLSLGRLETDNPEGYELVMLRYFTGLTVPEIAEAWGVSLSTVERKWRFVKAWLVSDLGGSR